MDIPRNQFDALARHGCYFSPETDTVRVVELIYESPIRLWERSAIYGRTVIGAYTFINKGFNAANIVIGRFCSMASYIREVGDHEKAGLSTHPIFTDRNNSFFPGDPVYSAAVNRQVPPHPPAVATGPTTIGNDVWIGEGVILKNGVHIGNGAIIGANTFVREDVPPYSLVVGCPGRIVRPRFPDKTIERLEKVQWWNYDVSDFINGIDASNIEGALDIIEEGIAKATVKPLRPERWMLHGNSSNLVLSKLVS